MNFNKHFELRGAHAFLSPSKHHWTNYDDAKFISTFRNHQAAVLGVRYHEYAKMAIDLKVRQVRTRKTINAYINDAIAYGMDTEQVLCYSKNAFGTADAISFDGTMLRIHDLKTGVNNTSMKQLYIYAALFCLEYTEDPHGIEIELRIYQKDEVKVEVADPDLVQDIMAKIIYFDDMLETLKAEE